MKNIALIVLVLTLSTTGCSMCCGPFDYDYPAFGGKQLRANRSHGRVGSILSDPITTLRGSSADSNLTEHPLPVESASDEDDDLYDDEILDEDLDTDDGDSGLEELEGIEPLRTEEAPGTQGGTSEDSTASSRWRPRPLR